jgi:RNA polymerase sigma-70 factor (ECF subfamily)
MHLFHENPPVRRDRFYASYRRELAFVARTLRFFGVPHAEVDDAVQEVFLVLHLRWHDLDANVPLRTWLHGVVRRVSGNHRRARSRRRTEPLDTAVEDRAMPALTDTRNPLPDELFAAKQGLQRLQLIVDRLPPARRAVYLLTELEEMTAAEIARRVQRPRNTVSSQLRAARLEVRELLARGNTPKTWRAAPARV